MGIGHGVMQEASVEWLAGHVPPLRMDEFIISANDERKLPILSDVLADDFWRLVFEAYAKLVFVPELIAFREAVHDYEALFAPGVGSSIRLLQQRRSTATAIVKRFCRSDSPEEVPLSGKVRADVKAKAAEKVLGKDLFSAAAAECTLALEAMLPQFARSELVQTAQSLRWLLEQSQRCDGRAAEDNGMVEEWEADAADVAPAGCWGGRARDRGGRKKRQAPRSEDRFRVRGAEGQWAERGQLEQLWRAGLLKEELEVAQEGDETWMRLEQLMQHHHRMVARDPTQLQLEQP